jgi:hypothetical protein
METFGGRLSNRDGCVRLGIDHGVFVADPVDIFFAVDG